MGDYLSHGIFNVVASEVVISVILIDGMRVKHVKLL